MIEQQEQFESRKVDHLRFAMDPAVQASGSGFDQIDFVHESLPELDFADVSITSALFLESSPTPFFISSMTAGHSGSLLLNERLAVVSAAKGWPMGVGSQRRELSDRSAAIEWRHIRRRAPKAIFFGNIGLSPLIETMPQANGLMAVQNLVDSLEATAMTIHLTILCQKIILRSQRFNCSILQWHITAVI